MSRNPIAVRMAHRWLIRESGRAGVPVGDGPGTISRRRDDVRRWQIAHDAGQRLLRSFTSIAPAKADALFCGMATAIG
jgi:hypothetical protein